MSAILIKRTDVSRQQNWQTKFKRHRKRGCNAALFLYEIYPVEIIRHIKTPFRYSILWVAVAGDGGFEPVLDL